MSWVRKQTSFLSFFFLLSGFAFSPNTIEAQLDPPELVIYTYDSFLAQGGLGSLLFPQFEKKEGCRIRAIAHGDGGQLLSRLKVDSQRGKALAQVVLGVDQHVWERLKPLAEPWNDWVPAGYSEIKKEIRLEAGFLPYDYGVLSLMADQELLDKLNLEAPTSLSDLLKPGFKRNIILEDPRTSTPGLAFLLFTQNILGKSVWSFWTNFRSQWLTLAPGWDGAYQLFLRKEAPLVWSYVTSQAYHEENGNKKYKALLFKEGQPLQIEGAVIVKGALKSESNRNLARKFLEFMISSEAQKWVARKVWMMPARKDVALPESFKKLPQPFKIIPIHAHGKEIEESLAQWSRVANQR